MAILIEGMRRRDDQERLEVDALDEAQIDAAMTTWQPSGSG
ncbi:Putative transcriptional regulator, TetR family [Mycobacteroides abscessus subsp. abscessus]|nr:Putative transcriptional regulator, TetR family [Mycobacteroides abscessus subsp. abscessus]